MSDFRSFSVAVHNAYNELSKGELYVVDVPDIFATYLSAFPEGTNPMYRQRTYHDCNCCKQFVRRLGTVVGIRDGRVATVWDDFKSLPYPYDVVSERLSQVVRQAPIVSIFRTREHGYGTAYNYDTVSDVKWNHFHGKVAARHRSSTPEKERGDRNTTVGVLRRGLEELTQGAFETVIGLIDGGSLYRGDTFRSQVEQFRRLQADFLAAADKNLFVWQNLDHPASRVRNTAIGTLLIDLSEGLELDQAVRKFEAVVAPQNYKRPKALVTPKMIEAAVSKLEELGLDRAVERRMARIGDVSINDILFVDNSSRERLKGGLRAKLLEGAARKPVDVKGAVDISHEDFFSKVLPEATSLQVLFEPRHVSNLVTVTAPQHGDSGRLFAWDNDFAWSYNGEVADSIKERVKRAGGNVEADLRVSLAWFNFDDLDIHAQCPDGHIYYASPKSILDVDMNAGGRQSRTPVENLSWNKPKKGTYRIWINQFCQRETSDVGFEIEIQNGRRIERFRYEGAVTHDVEVCKMTVENGSITSLRMGERMIGGPVSTEVWGVMTGQLADVEVVMNSPNHWEPNTVRHGNKHWFFTLKGCKNPDPVRGIYNEFLSPKLNEHRKVFELLGARTRCEPTDDQLSGVGFTAGRDDSVTVVVTRAAGATRAYNVKF